MGKEGKSFEEEKEGKMEKEKIPEWLKGVKEKLTEDNGLYQGLEKISELSNLEQLVAKENLEELLKKFSKSNMQEDFENRLAEGWIDKAKEVEAYASEKEIELNLKEGLQKGFEGVLAEFGIDGAKEVETYATERGIELNLKEGLQKGLEGHLAKSRIHDLKEIESYATEKGIELTLSKGIEDAVEESYIRVIHNPNVGHVEQQRNKLIEKAKEKGIELDYNKVVKMDYLDFLDVSEKDRFQQKKEVKIGDVSLESKFYGQIKENKCGGKFILAENPKTKEVSFIFDATMGEHKDIGNKYDVDVIGGGWLEIDQENKKVTIKRESQDFGYEPRMISAAIIIENFPNYEVNIED